MKFGEQNFLDSEQRYLMDEFENENAPLLDEEKQTLQQVYDHLENIEKLLVDKEKNKDAIKWYAKKILDLSLVGARLFFTLPIYVIEYARKETLSGRTLTEIDIMFYKAILGTSLLLNGIVAESFFEHENKLLLAAKGMVTAVSYNLSVILVAAHELYLEAQHIVETDTATSKRSKVTLFFAEKIIEFVTAYEKIKDNPKNSEDKDGLSPEDKEKLIILMQDYERFIKENQIGY